jgi:hypothetical protein
MFPEPIKIGLKLNLLGNEKNFKPVFFINLNNIDQLFSIFLCLISAKAGHEVKLSPLSRWIQEVGFTGFRIKSGRMENLRCQDNKAYKLMSIGSIIKH